MATQQGVIKTFMTALDTTTLKGSAAVDAAIKNCSNFAGTQAVIDKMVSELKNYIAVDSKNGWKNFLNLKCGINFDNKDTGAITGYDAGGSKVKTSESIVPESGSLKNYKKNSFTKNGLTFTLEKNFEKLSSEQKFIWKGLYTWWAAAGLNLVKESYGYSFNDSDVNFKEITVKFVNNSSTTLLAWSSWNDFDSDGKIDKAALTINMDKYKNIDTTNPNGYSSSALFYLDKTLAHEFTHALMHAKIDYEYKFPEFIYEGLAELTVGIDDERKSDITYLAKNPSVLEKNLKNTSTAYSYEAGYMFFRYLAKQAVSKSIFGTNDKDTLNNAIAGATISALAGNDTIRNTGSSVSIVGGNGNDSVSNSGNKVTILGGAGNDTFKNYGTNVTMNGGNDADYIYSGYDSSNVSIFGGAGNDSIYSYGSKITINAYNDDDRIYNEGSKTKIYAGAGVDSIFNHAATVTIDGGNDANYISNFNGKVSIFGGAGVDSIFNHAATVTIDGGNDADYISNFNGKVSIFGGAGNDSLFNSSVGSGVTLDGGNDDDYFSNKGSKVLIRGGTGKDTIKNYGANVTIDGGNNADKIYSYASSKVTLIGGDGDDHIENNGSAASMVGGNGDDTLTGYSGADTLCGGADNDKLYGNNGNDSLWGGKGNDSLWGGTGKDVFIYKPGEGTDRIKDYSFSEGDIFKILKSDGSAGGTYTSSSFKSNNLTLAISGGGSVIFEGVSAGDKFNINGKTYTIKGKALN